ncbi:MAG: hypothetical protein SP1CHLAM54_14680 [Chlamydiia bacterium]|nr:hypothetical protein [Chlamydiia bacterium]MCH9616358.1 hypothetical protein [Chlamydiia bacterium]MCH9629656.1 hypothetical protein [Chlamydiia bacterium]
MSPLEERYQSAPMVNLFKDAFAQSTQQTLLLELERVQKAFGVTPTKDTSYYVSENTRLIRMKVGLSIIEKKLYGVLAKLDHLAVKYADTPCANSLDHDEQTTIGKHFALILQDFLWDYQALKNYEIPFLGVKGSRGSQTALLKQFEGDEKKVTELDALLTEAMGFTQTMTLATHTYSRKIDLLIHSKLSHIASSAHTMAQTLKDLSYLGETSKMRLKHLYELSKEKTESFLTVDAILELTLLSLDALSIRTTDVKPVNTGRAKSQVMELHDHLKLFNILKH